MISDNFKKAILLYVYYMGGIDLWLRVYCKKQINLLQWSTTREKKVLYSTTVMLIIKKEKNQKSMETAYRTWFLGLIDNIDACTLYFLYIKPLHLGFCPSRCDSKCDQKSLRNVQISTVWAS